MRAELIALDITSSEAEWLKYFSSSIPLIPTSIPSIYIYCDSRVAIDFYKKTCKLKS